MMVWNAMTSNSGNMMYKITIVLFGFILISAAPFASAQFAVGGSASGGGSGGGGGTSNCDSNGFGNNNSLQISQVSYDIESFELAVHASSTCGSIISKVFTDNNVTILGLSANQPFLDEFIAVYSTYLEESDKKFRITLENKANSFNETFYINDKSIIKKYTGNTGYTSGQQGLPNTSTQSTILSEPSVTVVSPTIEESISVENQKQISDEKLIVDQTQSIEYTPEPEAVMEPVVNCEPGTELVNGICEIIQTQEKSSDGGGCLIATATYGSEMALEVQQLRELRDNTLLNTESGTAFMSTFNDIYYSFSPTIADMERESPLFKEIVKIAITPMISSLSIMENANSESEVLGLGLSVIALNLGMYIGVPAIVVIGIRKKF